MIKIPPTLWFQHTTLIFILQILRIILPLISSRKQYLEGNLSKTFLNLITWTEPALVLTCTSTQTCYKCGKKLSKERASQTRDCSHRDSRRKNSPLAHMTSREKKLRNGSPRRRKRSSCHAKGTKKSSKKRSSCSLKYRSTRISTKHSMINPPLIDPELDKITKVVMSQIGLELIQTRASTALGIMKSHTWILLRTSKTSKTSCREEAVYLLKKFRQIFNTILIV